MAEEALRLKVDKDIFNQTISQLGNQLDELRGERDRLQNVINRLKNGNTFSGSDVEPAIEKAEDLLEKVKDAISRVMGHKEAIEKQLAGTESAATQLKSDLTSIDLPNMFS